jgi:hypothetical protein
LAAGRGDPSHDGRKRAGIPRVEGRSLDFLLEADQRRLIEEFQRLRNAEYAEVGEHCHQLLEQLEREKASGKFTFVEVEEKPFDAYFFATFRENCGEPEYDGGLTWIRK